MSFMRDKSLLDWATNGGVMSPNYIHVQPASIDLTWSGLYRIPDRWSKDGWSEQLETNVLVMDRLQFFLLGTTEYIGMPGDKAGMLIERSTPARSGLVLLPAGLVEPDFCGQLTLEAFSIYPWPIEIKKGDRLVQMVVGDMDDFPAVSYARIGHYQGQTGATPPVKDNL